MPPTTRLAEEGDLERLRQIEVLAGQMFAEIGMRLVAEDLPASVEALRVYVAEGHAFVADDPDLPGHPAGYLLVEEVDGLAHLEQISVDPAFAGRGLGGLLVERAVAWARDHGYPAITLTTFTDVAWNGPWYSRLCFRTLETLTPGLRSIREREKAHGLDSWPRAAMHRDLGQGAPEAFAAERSRRPTADRPWRHA
jgi:GNAT superfamily N-acetyltransferase